MASYGFLTVTLGSRTAKMSFGGNMGNNLSDVSKAFDALYGLGKFEKILPSLTTDGYPDYLWTAKCKRKVFDAIVF